MKLEFSQAFRKILEYKISFKSVLLDQSCSMRADGRGTHMTKLFAIRPVANAPKHEVTLVPSRRKTC